MGEFSRIALAYILIFFLVFLSRRYRLSAERDLIESTLRTTLQLLLLGYFLGYLFHWRSTTSLLAVILLMSLAASFIAAERFPLGGSRWRGLLVGGFSLNVSSALVFLSLYLMGAIKHNYAETITLWGLVLGNSLSNVTLAFERLSAEAKNRRNEIEAKVALGASLRTAMEDCIKAAMRAAMMPKYNMLKSAGIVHIPGVSAGMVIAGMDPMEAMVYQILVMYMLLSVGFLTSLLVLLMSYRHALR
ncbi:conserved hypothetical protein [Thermocrinis albus DSM 14484]|uniref:Iron export ABC transporter permease subunit FetB n=1 Tax=Thermocrinis albus (strain DSM 14484 / JCM 11386 / HI 11/12) TaxID=638303 RepID=D3SP44_THEAH|nr:ABC transporter permease [Thermocrinis albus]ADC88931.1 conserved hypothetical protein [Thermocrinis albus DSM 14484]